MVERRIELDRRYRRKKKMAKLKGKLANASPEDREKILFKIHRQSPMWKEPVGETTAAGEPAAAPAKKAKK